MDESDVSDGRLLHRHRAVQVSLRVTLLLRETLLTGQPAGHTVCP